MFVYLCHMCAVPTKARRGHQIFQNWSCHVSSGIEPGSSRKAVSALNHWVISLVLDFFFILKTFL